MNKPLVPAGLVDIFFDEARRISATDDEALRLANEALTGFLSHYSMVKRRTFRRAQTAAHR